MACRLSELVLNCSEPERLARFWCEVLGYVELDRDDGDIEIGPVEGFGGAAPTIVLARVDDEKREQLRLHWDVNPVGCTQEEELERLLQLGATRADVGQGDEVSWVVLADPDGNEFCLLQRELPTLAQ